MITEFDRRDRIAAVASLVALLVAVVSVSVLVHVLRAPLLDTSDALPPVATFAPIPASSAPQAPHTPPSLVQLPFVHGKTQPEVAR